MGEQENPAEPTLGERVRAHLALSRPSERTELMEEMLARIESQRAEIAELKEQVLAFKARDMGWSLQIEEERERASAAKARAARLEAGLWDIATATPDWLAENGGAERLVNHALETLSDPQPEQGEG